MDKAISHDRKEESAEAKARWFQSLPLSERMEMLCSFTDLALTANPRMSLNANSGNKDIHPLQAGFIWTNLFVQITKDCKKAKEILTTERTD
jgi:hypothetical protein